MRKLQDTRESYTKRAIELFNDSNRAALESIKAKREGASLAAIYYMEESRYCLSNAIEFSQIATDTSEWA